PTGDFTSLEVVDLNGDGNLDLVAGGLGGVAVFLNSGFGLFDAAQQVLTDSGAVPWVLAAVPGPTPTVYAAANGPRPALLPLRYAATQGGVVAGTPIPTPYAADDLASGDFDGDGQVDLAVRDTASGRVLLRLGPDFTTEVDPGAPADAGSSRLAVADFF